jgi:hypothetical protein
MELGSKSKPKGGRGEREVCKILGDTFNGSFIRSANSGAYVGGTNKFRKQTLDSAQIKGLKGDIVPPEFMPKFVIECKLYADFAYHQFVTGSPIAQLDEWLDQALDCVDDGDFWVLTFRADRRAWAVAMPYDVFRTMQEPPQFIAYTDKQGRKYGITNLEAFVAANREQILKLTE